MFIGLRLSSGLFLDALESLVPTLVGRLESDNFKLVQRVEGIFSLFIFTKAKGA